MIYASVDLDHAVWIDVPPFWGGDSWRDEREWAQEVAHNCWVDSGLAHQEADRRHLSEVLAECARKWGPGSVHPEHAADPELDVHVILHLPDPRLMPCPIRVMVAEARSSEENLPDLRQFVMADDPAVTDPPELTEMQHPHFGPGLRSFRHLDMPLDDGGNELTRVYGSVRYAFPVPGHRAVLLVTASWPDLARLGAAVDDIDKLALAISWRHFPDDG